MPVNQPAMASGRMLRMVVMGYHAPLQPGAPRVTFADPMVPVVMARTVISQAPRSASPVVTAMAPGQSDMPGRVMGFDVPGGITDAGTGSTVPGRTVPARGCGHAGFAFWGRGRGRQFVYPRQQVGRELLLRSNRCADSRVAGGNFHLGNSGGDHQRAHGHHQFHTNHPTRRALRWAA